MSLSRGLIVTTLIAAVALAASGVMLPATRAVAAAPMVWTQAPGFYRMRLGDFEVTVINDGTISLDADKLLAEPPAKTDAALKRAFEASPVETSSNTFLINTGARLVLSTLARARCLARHWGSSSSTCAPPATGPSRSMTSS